MLKKILIPLVVGVLLATGGWTVKTESRVSVVESRTDDIKGQLNKIDQKLDRVLDEQAQVRQDLRVFQERTYGFRHSPLRGGNSPREQAP